jgi:excisionase family DNA binding protein
VKIKSFGKIPTNRGCKSQAYRYRTDNTLIEQRWAVTFVIVVAGRARWSEVAMSSTPHTTEGRLGEVRFLTVAEVATLMRVSKMTVYRLVHAGDLTAVRVGRSFRVPEHAVDAYLREAFRETA